MKDKYGFVRYDNQESAQRAVDAMDGKEIVEGSRKIQVELSHGMYWLIFFEKLSWRLFYGYFELLDLSSFFGRIVEQLNNNTDHLFQVEEIMEELTTAWITGPLITVVVSARVVLENLTSALFAVKLAIGKCFY